jgi:hypothetical protein
VAAVAAQGIESRGVEWSSVGALGRGVGGGCGPGIESRGGGWSKWEDGTRGRAECGGAQGMAVRFGGRYCR